MNELAHYGILGMRWGVRRSPAQLRRAANRDANKLGKLVVKGVEKAKTAGHNKAIAYLNNKPNAKQDVKDIKSVEKAIAKARKHFIKMKERYANTPYSNITMSYNVEKGYTYVKVRMGDTDFSENRTKYAYAEDMD